MVLSDYKPQSIIDFGTGLGTWLKVAEDLGVQDVLGIDGDWVDETKLVIKEDQFLRRNLHEELDLGTWRPADHLHKHECSLNLHQTI